MDCVNQAYRSTSRNKSNQECITIEDFLGTSHAWLRASPSEMQTIHLPMSIELTGQHGEGESPLGFNGSGSTCSEYRIEGSGRGSFEHVTFPERDLVKDSLFDSFCTTSPVSVDEQDTGMDFRNQQSRWIENASEGGQADPEQRRARRQAQNREAQRAHRAKQKSKLSTLESRVRLAESKCRLLEGANQRMEDVLRNLVNDAVKALTSPVRPGQAGQRPSKAAIDG